MANIGNDPKQKHLAAKYSQLAMTAIEHALPRGTKYVVILSGPGFNTYGSNIAVPEVIEHMQGLQGALQQGAGIRGD